LLGLTFELRQYLISCLRYLYIFLAEILDSLNVIRWLSQGWSCLYVLACMWNVLSSQTRVWRQSISHAITLFGVKKMLVA